MEINSTRADGAPSQGAVFAGGGRFPPISQLPTELLVAILEFTLPQVEFRSEFLFLCSSALDYMKRLHILRSVTKQWQDIIEGTPSFWTTIFSILPTHVKEASIRFSANLPLNIIYGATWYTAERPSAQEFLNTIEHTRQRWSSLALYEPENMSGYIEDPVPLLQTIIVWGWPPDEEVDRPLVLFGGETASNLRSVELADVSLCFKVGGLRQLSCLKLKRVAHDGQMGRHLLDILRTSPGLQILELDDIRAEIPPHSSIITLHQLKCIDINSCATDLVQWLFQHIRAPSCTKLHLFIGEGRELDVPHFINEILGPISGILSAIHKRYRGSEILLDFFGFCWVTDLDANDHGLSIFINKRLDPLFVEWVDRILQNEPGLRINFGRRALTYDAVLGRLARMRCVTEVLIDRWRVRREGVSLILEFLGPPLDTNGPPPPFPYLRELRIMSLDLNLEDLLKMVQSRSLGLSWDTMEPTPLAINLDRELVLRDDDDIPPPIIKFTTLAQIRETDGVRHVKFVGKNPVGTLAVKWDEEASGPVWF